MSSTDILTLVAILLAAAIPCWFLLQEQRKNLQLEAELSRAQEQARGYNERAVLAEKRAVEVADDRCVELIRARQRLADAREYFGAWEQAQWSNRPTRATVAREALAKAIGAPPASQRRIKEAS